MKQLTIPLHKKGAHDHCDNFRGIALLSVPGKVFCSVIQERLAGKSRQGSSMSVNLPSVACPALVEGI